MNSTDLRRLKDAFNSWASRHPEPDKATMGLFGQKPMSPREIAAAVESEAAEGKIFIRMVEVAIEDKAADLGQIVRGLTGSPKI